MLNGRYGPYITDGKLNGRIPKDRDPASLTLEEVTKLLEETGEPVRGRFGKKAAAKKEPAVKVAKKAAATKVPAKKAVAKKATKKATKKTAAKKVAKTTAKKVVKKVVKKVAKKAKA